jgi:hypothetical protein
MTEPLTPRHIGAYFGESWPSGVCEEGTWVPTPVGELCILCGTDIEDSDQGSFMGRIQGGLGPVHRECSLRSVLGGIGHFQDHVRWCLERRDPDGGLSYRASALAVWDWAQRHNHSGVD